MDCVTGVVGDTPRILLEFHAALRTVFPGSLWGYSQNPVLFVVHTFGLLPFRCPQGDKAPHFHDSDGIFVLFYRVSGYEMSGKVLI